MMFHVYAQTTSDEQVSVVIVSESAHVALTLPRGCWWIDRGGYLRIFGYFEADDHPDLADDCSIMLAHSCYNADMSYACVTEPQLRNARIDACTPEVAIFRNSDLVFVCDRMWKRHWDGDDETWVSSRGDVFIRDNGKYPATMNGMMIDNVDRGPFAKVMQGWPHQRWLKSRFECDLT